MSARPGLEWAALHQQNLRWCQTCALDRSRLTCCLQVGYCILHNGRMCSALEGRYLHIRGRCLRAADMLGALSYEAQAPLKMRPRSLGQDRACESVNAYLQVRFISTAYRWCILKASRLSLALSSTMHQALLTLSCIECLPLLSSQCV